MKTSEEIQALEERLAREVMGWSYQTFPGPQEHVKHWYSTSPCPNDPGHEGFKGRCPSPWTSPNDALEVLEASDHHWLLDNGPGNWSLLDGEIEDNSPEDWIGADSLPQAICLALEAWLGAKEAQ